jgi:pimeloyl-ACP methyl ester carboxylesterase
MSTWQQVDIDGKRADLFLPAQGLSAKSSVIFLHGHGRITLKDNAVYTSQFERLGLACVCPHGERSWWGEQICREFDSLVSPAEYIRASLLPWMKEKLASEPPSIALLGVDMGGQGAVRLAYRDPGLFPIVVALAPAVDFQSLYGRGLPLDELYPTAEAARQDTATLLLHPLNWPRHQFLMCDPDDAEWFDSVQRLASKLYSTGIPFERDFEIRHGGHSWDYFNHVAPRAMQFIVDRLAQEGRRLPTVHPTTG